MLKWVTTPLLSDFSISPLCFLNLWIMHAWYYCRMQKAHSEVNKRWLWKNRECIFLPSKNPMMAVSITLVMGRQAMFNMLLSKKHNKTFSYLVTRISSVSKWKSKNSTIWCAHFRNHKPNLETVPCMKYASTWFMLTMIFTHWPHLV